MTIEWILGIVGTVAAIVFGYVALMRNRRSDNDQQARQDGVILTELGYIKSGVDDLKAEQREQRKVNTEVYTRLTAVEASAKQAHKRIDHIENRMEGIES